MSSIIRRFQSNWHLIFVWEISENPKTDFEWGPKTEPPPLFLSPLVETIRRDHKIKNPVLSQKWDHGTRPYKQTVSGVRAWGSYQRAYHPFFCWGLIKLHTTTGNFWHKKLRESLMQISSTNFETSFLDAIIISKASSN